MSERTKSGLDMQISLSEMRLLITAVISFDPGQIVSAFLAVQRLKESLIKQVTKSSHCKLKGCVESNESTSQQSTEQVSLLDQMQSVFLRPDTPTPQSNSASESSSSHIDQSSSSEGGERQSYVETSLAVDFATTNTAVVQFAVSDTSTESFTNLCTTAMSAGDDNNGVAKKGSRLDELLRNHLTNPPAKSVNKQRHALCTKQVSDVVERSSVRMLKPRKRKNTVPRYNPHQSPLSSGKRLADCFRTPRSSSIARLLDVSSASEQNPPTQSTITTSPSNTDTGGSASGEDIVSTSKDSSMSSPPATALTETFNASVGMMTDRLNALPPSGPFVTNAADTLSPLHSATTDVDFTLSSSLTDNFVGVSGDLPTFALGDQGYAAGISEMALFDDIAPQQQLWSSQDVRKAPHVKPPKTVKRHVKSSSQEQEEDISQVSEELSSSNCKSEVALLRMRCKRCSERFTSKTDYQMHLKSRVCSTGYTHTYSCQVCGYCALTRQRLIVHMRTHSGERPHRCPFCTYAATQQAPLKRHMQNIHLKAGAISLTNSEQPAAAPLH